MKSLDFKNRVTAIRQKLNYSTGSIFIGALSAVIRISGFLLLFICHDSSTQKHIITGLYLSGLPVDFLLILGTILKHKNFLITWQYFSYIDLVYLVIEMIVLGITTEKMIVFPSILFAIKCPGIFVAHRNINEL